MATKITIDPVTRLEGHLKVEVTVDTTSGRQAVVDARATGTLFRGLEALLTGRHPWDAHHITQRICGVCPVSHGIAAVKAIDRLTGVTVSANARLLRNIVLGADFLHSHLLHFYQLAALDFIDGPAMAPWQPSLTTDRRCDAATTRTLVDHYVQALDMRRKAHELGAIFGGRMPSPPSVVPGGFTGVPTSAKITKARALLTEIRAFVSGIYLRDVETVATAYADYFDIGAGPGNLLAFGVFEQDASGQTLLLSPGRVQASGGGVQAVSLSAIGEDVAASFYSGSNNVNPANGQTRPVYPKTGAYSWLKAPRYASQPYEAGPLARMTVNGDYDGGVSVMDRHRARALETLKIADAMVGWLGALTPSGPVYQPAPLPASGSGVGLTEAPRGALGHWLRVANGTIANYQVLTPTCWNASPRDARGVLGPIERALVGTPVDRMEEPVEVLRVIHSFDPCLACAVHVMRPGKDATVTVAA